MEKEPDLQGGRPLFQQSWKQHQVVVVYPDKIVRLNHFQHTLAEHLIDVLVLLPHLFLIDSVRRKVVKERPDGFVAETEIELIHLFLREEDRMRRVLVEDLCPELFFESNVDCCAGPTNPEILIRWTRLLMKTGEV